MTDHASQRARHHSGKVDLRTVARRAMIERSLEPDFSDAALAELAQLTQSAGHGAPLEAPK
ncbi:MAG: hypothetical protein ABI488_13615, partial [Polyangiaceae bacterium]